MIEGSTELDRLVARSRLIGSVVDIVDEGGETMTVEVSAVGGGGTVSPTSPLGSALLGRKPGDTVDVQAPRGSWHATIQSIR